MKLPIFRGDAEIVGLSITRYPSNQAIALLATISWQDGEVEQVPVSVNLNHGQSLQSHELPPGDFFAKSYSDGEPIFKALLDAGFIETTNTRGRTGFVEVPACHLTQKGKEAISS